MADLLNVNTASTESRNEGAGLTDQEAKALAFTIAEAADDRKAADIKILKVSEVSYLADYFVVVTGFSNVQVRAIARSVENAVSERWQRKPINTEGTAEGRWVLQDYGEVIVHIFLPREREYYDLEAFWGHAEVVEFISNPVGSEFRNPLQ
ncbi:MAG: ribosome silencing factor [Leptolyngbya sp. SIO4C1]|nr:ribosome silencing factor [Leptolyngbya sp. SIO4C1]